MPYKSRYPAIIAAATVKAAGAVSKTAHDIEAGAKVRSRVDSGAMKGAWQAVPLGQFEYEVSNGVEYAVFHELGTRYIPAQPMLVPATEAARPGFEAAVRSIFG